MTYPLSEAHAADGARHARPRPIKIVINAFSARIGGGRTYLANLLRHLPDEPIEISLFAYDDFGIEDPRVKHVPVRWPVRNQITRRLWERFALPRYLRASNADVLFVPGGIVGTEAPEGCRVATMFRNMQPFDPMAQRGLGFGFQRLRNLLLRPAMLHSMAGADLTIFISGFAREFIERLIPIKHAVTIPHGVPDRFRTATSASARPAVAGDGDYLLYVSRFEVYKHHRQVIDGFDRVPLEVRGDLRLLLAGETNYPEAKRMKAHVRALGLEDQVIFLGGVPYDQLPPLYRNARAILFASSCENCPNILLEAMGAGRPLLSSNVMPMPEFGGPDIAYFDPSDSDDLAAALTAVLTDDDHAKRIGRAAALRSELYQWKTTGSRTWEALITLGRTDP